MTHQVLARKWRPSTFADVSGQQHVVRALSNALQQRRLHHAYLLTGTRGVGKTTLARILAKCLNCERGMTHEPCLTCDSCQAIEQGQFIDLIEIDAASRTRVEDTRDLLDNVQYMPTVGRYKVYLIDEVHMLSNHSFNALLKTLEEPPAHVIFILATTDPERLPITVLSRCLQFQLKAMTNEQITQRLAYILQDEKFEFTPAALSTIANAAQGSMRDALSLLDQVIALGQGKVTEQAALDLLGGITTDSILQLLKSISDNQGAQVLELIQQWLHDGIDFQHAMNAVIDCLHQISILQMVPEKADQHVLSQTIAQQLTKEQIQLYYQIALYGKRDLPYAPTPRLGFEMTMLRMLAFAPATEVAPERITKSYSPLAENQSMQAHTNKREADKKIASTPLPSSDDITIIAPEPQHEISQPLVITNEPLNTPAAAIITDELDWATIIQQLNLSGPTKVLADYCLIKQFDADTLMLELDGSHRAMLTQISQEKLTNAITNYYGKPICVKIAIGQSGLSCPANLARQRETAILEQAEQTLLKDAGLQSLLQRFDASIEPGSIQPKSQEETNK
ncbi:MAG: DNA polymerase III subunit gamma/tau [Gammaproteobacteria bacterium]